MKFKIPQQRTYLKKKKKYMDKKRQVILQNIPAAEYETFFSGL